MGCVCCSLSTFVSILLDALERISLCTVCAMLVCCLLWTCVIVLILGVGIGYHYCFVQTSVEAMARAAKSASDTKASDKKPTPPPQTSGRRARDHRNSPGLALAGRARRDVDIDPPFTNNGTQQNFTVGYNNVYGRQPLPMKLNGTPTWW